LGYGRPTQPDPIAPITVKTQRTIFQSSKGPFSSDCECKFITTESDIAILAIIQVKLACQFRKLVFGSFGVIFGSLGIKLHMSWSSADLIYA